jgi:oligopeptide transport system substrate-binding protein
MSKLIYIYCGLVLISCGNAKKNKTSHAEAIGGRTYGGTLRVNEIDRYISLYPPLILDETSVNIATQIYDGLVRFDPKNVTQVLPDIAQSWEVDASGLVYTFKLNKGIVFHDNPCFPNGKGRELKAADIKYAFELLCTSSKNNKLFEISFKGLVVGADNYYNSSKSGKTAKLVGVKILDDYKLQITLTSSTSSFLYILATAACFIIPHEAIEKYGVDAVVGTGPFVVSNSFVKDKLLLTRNPYYHRTDSLGNRLPFLDSIDISFISSKSSELEAFQKGNIDLIFGLPASSISKMVEANIADFSSKNPKYFLQRNSEYSTHYYKFNIYRKPFDNLKVRQAFSYAIDREKIISDVLNTEAFGPGICGLTPPSISGYDITEIKGYNYNPEKAKRLLAESGYPNGKNFPQVNVEINSGGGKFVDVVEEVKKQIKAVLNVEIEYLVVPFAQKLEDEKWMKAEMFRAAWTADFPTPENFLRNMYGANIPESLNTPSYPNTVRYKNPIFDSLFEAGLTSKSQEKSYFNYLKAEQIMMQDAPILILWYGEKLKMNHSYVKNFYFNPMNHKDFSEVYLIKPAVEQP